MAKRAEEFAAREKALETLVNAFHTSAEQAEKVRTTAAGKATKLRTDAEEKATTVLAKAEADAAVFDEKAAEAIRKILAAGESPESAAELTGWPLARVRQAQRASASPATRIGEHG